MRIGSVNWINWTPSVTARMLRERREHYSLTQQDLANNTGLPKTTISKIETGQREPTWSDLIKLLYALEPQAADGLVLQMAELASGERGKAARRHDAKVRALLP